MKRLYWCGVVFLIAISVQAEIDPPVLDRLVLDAMTKQYDAKITDKAADFVFSLTNTWTNEMTIDRVRTSCGCAVASLPSQPWHIPAGGRGEVTATVHLEGKGAGLLAKTMTLYVSTHGQFVGTRIVTLKVLIPAAPVPPPLSADERSKAMEMAKADPQRIFKDSHCAACHVQQGINAWGRKLYAADCGICHDSPKRATLVPDLRGLKTPTSYEYWKAIIANGKPHTLMPGFALAVGGPLNAEQIHSIAQYLAQNFGNHTP